MSSQSLSRGEPVDFQSREKSTLNRKATKIEYLSQENGQLKEEIAELQNMLRLNKEALKITMNGFGSQSSSSSAAISPDSHQEQTTKLRSADSRGDNPKALNMVLHALYEENAALQRKVERISEERDVAQSKAFINEQISEASQKHEREMLSELEEKVSTLTKKLRESEKTVQQLERCTPEYDEETGIVIKYRDVISINDQTKVMHDEMEKLNTIIGKQLKAIDDLKNDRADLLKLNMSLSNEVIKLKTTLQASYPIGRMSYPDSQSTAPSSSNGPNTQMLMKFHQKMTKNPNGSDDENDDEEYSFDQLPDKCEKNINVDRNTTGLANSGPETNVGLEESKPNPIQLAIPKLDLTRAKKIMEMNAIKSTQQQQQKEEQAGNVQLYIQKLKKLEKEIDVTRRNFSREMLLNKTLTIQNEGLKRANDELASRNEILVNSHYMFEEKWTKIVNAFEFYKDYYKKHVDLISSRKSPQSPNRSALPSDNENSYDAERILKIKNQQANLCLSQIAKIPSQIQKSMMQVNNEDFKFEQERKQQLFADGAYSRVDAQGYMVQMAKDLYQQIEKTKTEKLFVETTTNDIQGNEGQFQQGIQLGQQQQLKQQENAEIGNNNQPFIAPQQGKLKRCFSNTLDYVNPLRIQEQMEQMLDKKSKLRAQFDRSSIAFQAYKVSSPQELADLEFSSSAN